MIFHASFHFVINHDFSVNFVVVKMSDNIAYSYNGVSGDTKRFLDFLDCALVIVALFHPVNGNDERGYVDIGKALEQRYTLAD